MLLDLNTMTTTASTEDLASFSKSNHSNADGGSIALATGPAAHKITQLPSDYVLGDNDVICGRGSRCFNHEGNRKFRELVERHLERYMNTTDKNGKTAIICEIVKMVRDNSPNGGFVKKDNQTGIFFEVGDFLAREKTSQAFRDASEAYKSSNSTKKKNRLLAVSSNKRGSLQKSLSVPTQLGIARKGSKRSVLDTSTENDSDENNGNGKNAVFGAANSNTPTLLRGGGLMRSGSKRGLGMDRSDSFKFTKNDHTSQGRTDNSSAITRRCSLLLEEDLDMCQMAFHQSYHGFGEQNSRTRLDSLDDDNVEFAENDVDEFIFHHHVREDLEANLEDLIAAEIEAENAAEQLRQQQQQQKQQHPVFSTKPAMLSSIFDTDWFEHGGDGNYHEEEVLDVENVIRRPPASNNNNGSFHGSFNIRGSSCPDLQSNKNIRSRVDKSNHYNDLDPLDALLLQNNHNWSNNVQQQNVPASPFRHSANSNVIERMPPPTNNTFLACGKPNELMLRLQNKQRINNTVTVNHNSPLSSYQHHPVKENFRFGSTSMNYQPSIDHGLLVKDTTDAPLFDKLLKFIDENAADCGGVRSNSNIELDFSIDPDPFTPVYHGQS